MTVIRTYRLRERELQLPKGGIIDMPAGAKLIHVGADNNGRLRLWAMADPSEPTARRGVAVVDDDGNAFKLDQPFNHAPLAAYVGTAVLPTGFVYHVFDLGELPPEVTP